MSAEPGVTLHCGAHRLDLSRPRVMGVINLTPDSFSDGGELYRDGRIDTGAVRARAERMLADGASILDIGGESTRPGAAPISDEDERARVLPALRVLVDLGAPISVDTSNPSLMRAVIDGGAALINDVRSLTRPGALAVVAASDVGVCVMHMQGEPRSMQQAPVYADVVIDVRDVLAHHLTVCEHAGITRARLLADPGFGFGKTPAHNLQLLRELRQFGVLGVPILVGLSRKRTIGLVTGQSDARLRVAGSVAAAVLAVERGAKLIRVHDVRETVDALNVVQAMSVVQAMDEA